MKIAIVALACLVACVSAGVHRDAPEHPSDKVGNLPKCNKSNVGSFHRHQHPLKYWECIKDRFFFPVYYPAQRDCPAWTFFSEKCEKCVRNPFTCDVKPEPEPEPEPEPTEETPIEEVTEEEPVEEVTEEEPIEEVTEEEPVEEVTEPEPEPEVPEESSENSESSENGSDSSESGSNSSESGSNSSESGSSSSSESGSDSQETSPGSGETDPEVEPTDAPVDSGEVEPTDAPEVEPTNAPVDSGEVEPTDAPEVEPTDAPVDSGEVEPTPEPTPEPTQAPEPTPAPEDPSCEVKCVKPWDEPEYHADPESCGHFYQCSNGKPHQLACPEGLVFNPNANPGPVCDWAYNYPCSGKPGCPAPTPAPEPSCQKPVCSEHVDQEKGEYHPNPEDCSSFYHCAQAADFSWYPVLQDCPSGLEFNAALNVCDYPADAKCTVTCPTNKGIFF